MTTLNKKKWQKVLSDALFQKKIQCFTISWKIDLDCNRPRLLVGKIYLPGR